MNKDSRLPQKKNNDEIISLNPELYPDLSITELEERLEMACWINFGCSCEGGDCNYVCVYVCVYESCVADCIGDGGGTT